MTHGDDCAEIAIRVRTLPYYKCRALQVILVIVIPRVWRCFSGDFAEIPRVEHGIGHVIVASCLNDAVV